VRRDCLPALLAGLAPAKPKTGARRSRRGRLDTAHPAARAWCSTGRDRGVSPRWRPPGALGVVSWMVAALTPPTGWAAPSSTGATKSGGHDAVGRFSTLRNGMTAIERDRSPTPPGSHGQANAAVIADGARPLDVKRTAAPGHPTVLFSHVLSSLALYAAALHLDVRRCGVHGALYPGQTRCHTLASVIGPHKRVGQLRPGHPAGAVPTHWSWAPVGYAGCPSPLTTDRSVAVGSAPTPAAPWRPARVPL
jgi:hypothetical protein